MFSVGFRNETTGVGPQPQFGAPHPRSAFVHSKAEEFYVCIYATREGDYVLFHHEGGVDVGDVDAKAQKLLVGVERKESAMQHPASEDIPKMRRPSEGGHQASTSLTW